MKKFILLHQGFVPPTPEIGAGWMAWFEKIAPQTVDMGNPFVAGREVGKDGQATDLDLSGVPMTGYTIVNAESMDAAQALLDGLPMIHSTRIYELGSMQPHDWSLLADRRLPKTASGSAPSAASTSRDRPARRAVCRQTGPTD